VVHLQHALKYSDKIWYWKACDSQFDPFHFTINHILYRTWDFSETFTKSALYTKIKISLRYVYFNGDVLQLVYVYGRTGIINNKIYVCALYNFYCWLVHAAIDYMRNKLTWKSVKNSESQRIHLWMYLKLLFILPVFFIAEKSFIVLCVTSCNTMFQKRVSLQLVLLTHNEK
jgi:hypothetical protein